MTTTILQEMVVLLEFADLKKEVQRIAGRASKMQVSLRSAPGAASDFYIVADGSTRGGQAADDHEIEKMFKAIEHDVEQQSGGRYVTERIYGTRADAEKPNGLQIYSVNSTGKKNPTMKIWFAKKPVLRSKIDGDVKVDYKDLKIVKKADKPGVANEHMFIKMMNDKIQEAGGVLNKVVFDGYTNDQNIVYENIVAVNWVGGKNQKPDVELVNEDGEMFPLSLKQRDFFEIDAGQDFFNKNEKRIYSYLEKAMDEGHVEFDKEDKLSKDRHYEVAVEMTPSEAEDVFLGKGGDRVEAVIVETFLKKDFELSKNGLHIKCDYVIRSSRDIHDRIWPFISINSDFKKGDETRRVLGETYVSIIPRFRIQTHPRQSTSFPKTLILEP